MTKFRGADLAGCLLAGVSVQANAATLKDLFDEHYYADTYGDLKEAYGYDREALWQHFVTFGLSEGRNMNGLLDVVKYRQEYADLDQAFGDNSIDRSNEFEYDEDGNVIKFRNYGDNGILLRYGENEFDESGNQIKTISYDADGTLIAYEEYEYNEAGRVAKTTQTDLLTGEVIIYEHNEIGVGIKETHFRADGSVSEIDEYDASGNVVKRTYVDANGNVTHVTDADGNEIAG